MSDQDHKKTDTQKMLRSIDIVAGSYWTHYKGGVYQVVTLAVDESTLEPVVVYKSLRKGSIWVRTVKNWEEMVQVEGVEVERFKAGAP